MRYEKIVLVTRKTRLEGLTERFNTRSQARFYVEKSGGNFNIFEQEHEIYHLAVQKLCSQLQNILKVQMIERAFLPNFLFTEKEIVVTIGIDGLVVNTAKYLDGQPLIAVNPDPQRIDGILLPFEVDQAPKAVEKVIRNQHQMRQISMAEVRLQDGQRLRAFNDLFIGAKSHISARYRISTNGRSEHHSSSGIIISTGVGSTGWMSSIMNMSNGIMQQLGASSQTMKLPILHWEEERLLFAVREPFISKVTSASIVAGWVSPQQPLVIESEMPESGVIFSDGVEADFLEFNAGAVATVTLADVKTHLVIG